jgi:hypothetical protein
MLIIVTQDQSIVNWAGTQQSNARAWGQLIIISARSQQQATAQFTQALSMVGSDEPLCLMGHGNDTAIGDAGSGPADWTWSDADVAQILARNLGQEHVAPILIEACADTIANFAAHVAVQLESMRKLNGVWLYGYNRPVDVTNPMPDPHRLDRNVALQGTEVVVSSMAANRG